MDFLTQLTQPTQNQEAPQNTDRDSIAADSVQVQGEEKKIPGDQITGKLMSAIKMGALNPDSQNLIKIRRRHELASDFVRKIVADQDNVYRIESLDQDLLHKLKQQFRANNFTWVYLSLIGLAFGILSNTVQHNNGHESNSFTNNLRGIVTVSTVALQFFIYQYYNYSLWHRIILNQSSYTDTIWSTNLYIPMILEMFVCSLHWPPGVELSFEVELLGFWIEYTADDILTMWLFLRLYLFVRLLGSIMPFTNHRAQVLASRSENFEANLFFGLKAFQLENPMAMAGFCMIIITFVIASVLYICERNDTTTEDGDSIPSQLGGYWDWVWLSFVTQTTVGYGDIYPVTHFGRFVAGFISIFGNFYQGLLVVALMNKLSFSWEEFYAWVTLNKNVQAHSVWYFAAVSIQNAAKLWMLKLKKKRQGNSRSVNQTAIYPDDYSFTFRLPGKSAPSSEDPKFYDRKMIKTKLKMHKALRNFKSTRQFFKKRFGDTYTTWLMEIMFEYTYEMEHSTDRMKTCCSVQTLMTASDVITQSRYCLKLAKHLRAITKKYKEKSKVDQ